MTRLTSEIEVRCPCCEATLVVDANLRRVVSHEVPAREDLPELGEARKLLDDAAARREAVFRQSVADEKSRGDVLSRRFDEALRQAREEPVVKPLRDFDLD